jgi:hypothetical protein
MQSKMRSTSQLRSGAYIIEAAPFDKRYLGNEMLDTVASVVIAR